MTIRPFVHAALFFVILVSQALIAAGQDKPETPTAKQLTNVDIIYTGKLYGYFRFPSLQPIKATAGCHEVKKNSGSAAAEQFFRKKEINFTKETVLVGTGDNFAPQLEARVFSEVDPTPGRYTPANKELYVGNNGQWLFYTDLEKHPALRDKIEQGLGTIPSDNVACFLRRAGYAAIVPGKHDFYFGPERVRQLARFLARPKEAGGFEPVQMLGANLVMRTEPIKGTTVSREVKADRGFKDWPAEYSVTNLKDGNTVYPWFSVVKIKLAEIPSDSKIPEAAQLNGDTDAATVHQKLEALLNGDPAVLDQLGNGSKEKNETDKKRLADLKKNYEALTSLKPLKVCLSEGHPNQLPDDLNSNACDDPARKKLRLEDGKIVLYVYLKEKTKGKGKHFSTLETGKNFGLCTINDKNENACIRFSTHTPFFYFPHQVPDDKDGYNDPEPFIIKNNVAVFGVVDPALGSQVGALNFGWRHASQTDHTTRVVVEDPVQALQQQLDYFGILEPDFSGMKVLLAQMTPQRARELATQFPQFQIVVTAADQEQATSNITMSINWRPVQQSAGQFLATPAPYFNTAKRTEAVHFGMINATPLQPKLLNESPWALAAKADAGDAITTEIDPANDFWKRIKELPGCVPAHHRDLAKEKFDNQNYLKWLTLCAMQEYLGADVALIQPRDLFDIIPKLDEKYLYRGADPDDNVQQTLDRLIWKGDFITLIQVPGSALKKALEQSDNFDAPRKLETLGIRKTNDEYFINELPLEDTHVYTIATTDYIGAGDTGYPDLVKAARTPRGHPAAFTEDLLPISRLVCRKYFDNEAAREKYCHGPIVSHSYLDSTTASHVKPYPSESLWRRIWRAKPFSWPDARNDEPSLEDRLEHRVQRRNFRVFSLKNFSIGYKDLDNNRTDDSVKEKFAGVPTSGVSTSKENRNITVGVDARFSYIADKQEYYIGGGIDYDRQSTGDPTKATGISLNKNLAFGELGVVWWRRPGRDFPNIGFVTAVRGETQLERPFSAFNLANEAEDQVRITQRRGLLLLGRAGVRWQNKNNIFEIGGQGGREMRALRGYLFTNPGGTNFECLVNSTQTLSDCITENSKPPAGLITANSIPSTLQQGRPRAGLYWKHNYSFPILSHVKYELTHDADFFFVNFSGDTSIDTRFRYNAKSRVSVMIFKNLSIGPTLDLFMYQNKENRNFLFQRSIGIETKISFDIFNRREKGAQVIDR